MMLKDSLANDPAGFVSPWYKKALVVICKFKAKDELSSN